MSTITKKQVCKCENCGNEAEMVVTCSLHDAEDAKEKVAPAASTKLHTETKKVKGKGTCSHCGNEADMWIDL